MNKLLVFTCVLLSVLAIGVHGSATETLTPEALESKIKPLNPADLAWRKIAWKTCLFEALDQARQEKKPVLMWVLGGEPVDGRC